MKTTLLMILLLMIANQMPTTTTMTTTTTGQNSTTTRLGNEIAEPFQPTAAAPPPPTSTQSQSSASSLEMSTSSSASPNVMTSSTWTNVTTSSATTTEYPMAGVELQFIDGVLRPNVFSPFDVNASESDVEFWRQTSIAINDYCLTLCNSSTYPPRLHYLRATPHPCVCHCDRACFFYGDCCPDVFASMGYKPRSAIDEGIVRCSPTVFGSPEIQSSHFAMVTRCPDEDDVAGLLSETGLEEFRQLSAKCASSSLSHRNYTRPATNGEFVTFKNQYCARCFSHTFFPALGASHSKLHPLVFSVLYDVSNVTLWDVAVSVKDPGSVMHLTSSLELFRAGVTDAKNAVSYHWLTALQDRRRDCVSDLEPVSRCNVTGLWEHYDVNVERACLLLAINTPLMYYKNPFCQLCNTYQSWTYVCT